MALQSQIIPIVVNQGVDTKTDPKQVANGKLVSLQNGIFQTAKEIRKRNGYQSFSQNIVGGGTISSGKAIAAFQNELVMLDDTSLYSYSDSQSAWINKGNVPLTSLATQSITRTTTKQTNQDFAYDSVSNIYCYAWVDTKGSGGVYYSVIDGTTGANLVNVGLVATGFDCCKVLKLGSYFVIFYSLHTTGDVYYKYITISSPQAISSQQTIATDGHSGQFDAEIIGTNAVIAYDGGTSVKMYSLSSTLVLSTQYVNSSGGAAGGAACLSVVGDSSNNAWVSFANTNTYLFVVNSSLTSVLATTEIEAASAYTLTGTVSGSTITLLYELLNSSSGWRYIRTNTCTLTGTVGTPSDFIRSLSLASKIATTSNGFVVLANYPGVISSFAGGTYETIQPSYFLLNQSAKVIAKIAPSNAGIPPGITNCSILPEVSISGNNVNITYLIQDDVSSQNGSIFTNSGINLATVDIAASQTPMLVSGNNLLIPSARPTCYDGLSVTEEDFHLYPDNGGITANISGTGGGLGIQSSTSYAYQYTHVYTWRDNQGQIHRSAPSVPTTVTMPPNRYISQGGASFTNGSNNATVSDSSQMAVGMSINIYASGVWNGPYEISSITSSTAITVRDILSSSYTGPTVSSTNIVVADLRSQQPVTVFTGTPQEYSASVTGISSFTNLVVGQQIIDISTTQYFSAGTTIKSIDTATSTIVMSEVANTTAWLSGATFQFIVIDVWSVTLTPPMLRVTDKSNVIIETYRTAANGTVFYLTSSLTSPTYNDPTTDTASFVDTTADGALVGNQQLYTGGGAVSDLGPPAISTLTSYRSRAIGIPSEENLSFIYSKQVVPGVPVEWNNLDFSENVDSRILSLNAAFPLDDKLILFGPTRKFYLVGDGPSDSGANNDFSEAYPIAGVNGCTNPSSIVEIPDGLMYQTPSNGIWLLDRSLAESYIGAEVEEFNLYTVTSAIAIPNTTQVRFTLSNGVAIVYDYFFRQWSEFTNINASGACIFNSQYTYLTPTGLVLQETPGVYTDNGSFIQLSLTTSWLVLPNPFFVMGGLGQYRRVKKLLLLGQYKSPHTLNVGVGYDFDSTIVQTVSIPNLSDPGVYNYRIFFDRQRCETIQLTIYDTQTSSFGEGFSISDLSLEASLKPTLIPMPAAQSFS